MMKLMMMIAIAVLTIAGLAIAGNGTSHEEIESYTTGLLDNNPSFPSSLVSYNESDSWLWIFVKATNIKHSMTFGSITDEMIELTESYIYPRFPEINITTICMIDTYSLIYLDENGKVNRSEPWDEVKYTANCYNIK